MGWEEEEVEEEDGEESERWMSLRVKGSKPNHCLFFFFFFFYRSQVGIYLSVKWAQEPAEKGLFLCFLEQPPSLVSSSSAERSRAFFNKLHMVLGENITEIVITEIDHDLLNTTGVHWEF